jgi:hypothetical protein
VWCARHLEACGLMTDAVVRAEGEAGVSMALSEEVEAI